MPKFHEVEQKDTEKPILALFGEENQLTRELIKNYHDNFRFIFISDTQYEEIDVVNPDHSNQESNKKTNHSNADHQTYSIKKKESAILERLDEKIEYAIIILEKIKDKLHLNSVAAKFIKDKTQVLFIIKSTKIEDLYDIILEYKNEDSFSFALVGDIIDKQILSESGPLADIIKSAITKKSVLLTGNELYPVYSISLPDLVRGANHILFGHQKKDTIYQLYYSHPETLTSAIHLFSRIEPELHIEFQEEEKKDYGNSPNRDDIKQLLSQKLQMNMTALDEYFDGFEKSIKEIFSEKSYEKKDYENATGKNKKDQDPKGKIKKKIKNSIKSNVRQFLYSFLVGSFIFIFINVVFFFGGLIFLRESIQAFESKNYTKAKSFTKNSQLLLNLSEPSVRLGTDVISLVDQDNQLVDTYQVIKSTLSLSSLAATTFDSAFSKNASAYDIDLISAHAIYLYTVGERILIDRDNKTLETLLKPSHSKLLSLSQVLPYILGYQGERNYLLLFQNNGELRPNGGFIGSVGELKILEGKILEFNIQDVYELDGQLTKHVEPHYIVRRYLQPHLYLRDSNFSLNFQDSAKKIAEIYNLETKKEPDGIIAINFEVLRRALKIVGPITLIDYNKTLDSENIFDFVQDTIETEFFPGSTQKKDILNEIFNQIVLKIESDPNLLLSLFTIFPDLLEEKHILFALQEESQQSIFSANGYGGEMVDERKEEKNTFNDYLAINEANIGVNKANILVDRKVLYNIALGDEETKSILELRFINNHSSESYKAYIRVTTPQGSSLLSIKIDGEVQDIIPAIDDPLIFEAEDFKPQPGLEVDESTKYGKKTFGFIMNIKSKTTQTIEIEYTNGLKGNFGALTKYSFLYSKQPGTLEYALGTTINFPKEYSPLETTADSFGRGFVEFENTIQKDQEYSVTLKKD